MSQNAKWSNAQTFNGWLVPANFHCTHFVDNPRSTPGRDDNTSNNISVTRSSNETFEETYASKNDYSINYAIAISAKEKIKIDEELFLDYDALYFL